MSSMAGWIRATVVVGGALTVTACSTYPREPRYPVRPTDILSSPSAPAPAPAGATAPVSNPYYTGQPATPPATTPPVVEQGVRAPAGSVEGGALPPTVSQAYSASTRSHAGPDAGSRACAGTRSGADPGHAGCHL